MSLNIYSLAQNEGPAIWFLDSLTFIKATSKQTGGAFGLVEQRSPVGYATPYHLHRAEDETFYVIEGQLEFFSNGRRFTGGPGTSVFLPRDIPHGFRVTGTSQARFLVFTTPGGFEEFVTDIGRPATKLELPEPAPPDFARLKELAAKYRIEVLGPLPE